MLSLARGEGRYLDLYQQLSLPEEQSAAREALHALAARMAQGSSESALEAEERISRLAEAPPLDASSRKTLLELYMELPGAEESYIGADQSACYSRFRSVNARASPDDVARMLAHTLTHFTKKFFPSAWTAYGAHPPRVLQSVTWGELSEKMLAGMQRRFPLITTDDADALVTKPLAVGELEQRVEALYASYNRIVESHVRALCNEFALGFTGAAQMVMDQADEEWTRLVHRYGVELSVVQGSAMHTELLQARENRTMGIEVEIVTPDQAEIDRIRAETESELHTHATRESLNPLLVLSIRERQQQIDTALALAKDNVAKQQKLCQDAVHAIARVWARALVVRHIKQHLDNDSTVWKGIEQKMPLFAFVEREEKDLEQDLKTATARLGEETDVYSNDLHTLASASVQHAVSTGQIAELATEADMKERFGRIGKRLSDQLSERAFTLTLELLTKYANDCIVSLDQFMCGVRAECAKKRAVLARMGAEVKPAPRGEADTLTAQRINAVERLVSLNVDLFKEVITLAPYSQVSNVVARCVHPLVPAGMRHGTLNEADSELDALESQSCSTIFAALRESRTIPYDPSLHVCWMVRTTGALLGIAYAFTENK